MTIQDRRNFGRVVDESLEPAHLRDQADGVRRMVGRPPSNARVIALTSGKGGVGKTVLSVNLSLALAFRYKHVVLVDLDLGLPNADILLDMNPDRSMAGKIRQVVESGGDRITDMHLWRLGPGHLGAILSILTDQTRNADYYRTRLAHFKTLSHVTIEVSPASA